MSALPPKVDMCGAQADVRFVPKADIHAGQSLGRAGRAVVAFGPAVRCPGSSLFTASRHRAFLYTIAHTRVDCAHTLLSALLRSTEFFA